MSKFYPHGRWMIPYTVKIGGYPTVNFYYEGSPFFGYSKLQSEICHDKRALHFKSKKQGKVLLKNHYLLSKIGTDGMY